MRQLNKKIYKKCKSKNLHFQHVAEVGVYLPETSNILYFIQDNIKATLVEVHPEIIPKIKACFSDYPKVTLYPYAVWDKVCTLKFNGVGASTFANELSSSPAIINDNYLESSKIKEFEAQAVTFDKIDDGTIDLLSVDIEGAEWFVLKYLVSQPLVISIETRWGKYSNPYLTNIEQWMIAQDYIPWYRYRSDMVYFKKGLLELSWFEQFNLKFGVRLTNFFSLLRYQKIIVNLKTNKHGRTKL